MLPNLRAYVANEGLKALLAVIWLATNGLLFYYTFMYYYTGPQFYYLHQMLGYGLCISRASAACINLNCSALLLPMCKRLITRCRGFRFCVGRQVRRILDRSRSFHIYCGYLLCALAVVHCGAHAYNANYFSKYYNRRYADLNVAKYANQNPVVMMFTTVAGVTGIMLVVCLVLISVYASKPLRKNNHNRFWKWHHLFIAFYVILFLHGFDGVIKYQTNVAEHRPGCFVPVNQSDAAWTPQMAKPEPEPFPEPEGHIQSHKTHSNNAKDAMKPNGGRVMLPEPEPMNVDREHHRAAVAEPEPVPEHGAVESGVDNNSSVYKIFVAGRWMEVQECDQPPPTFDSCPRETWIWLCFPLLLYILERLLRFFYASNHDATIVSYKLHPSDVIELRMTKKNFSAKPGQSIWIRCPLVSRVESHPFTLTSVPTPADPTFSIHIKVLGDWTREFRDVVTNSDWGAYSTSKETLADRGFGNELHTASDAPHSRYDSVHVQIESQTSSPPLPSIDPDAQSLYDNILDASAPRTTEFDREKESCSQIRSSDLEARIAVDAEDDSPRFPKIFVEGPTGSAMQDVFKFRVAVCFAGGIGVTPFAAVLNSIRSDIHSLEHMKLKRLHLVWACRDVTSFEWFANLLLYLQEELWTHSAPDLLSVSLYSTNPQMSIEQEKKRFGVERCRLFAGRPDIARVLEDAANCHPRQTIGVFCCGPAGLTSSVRRQCFKSTSPSRAKFVFNKESF